MCNNEVSTEKKTDIVLHPRVSKYSPTDIRFCQKVKRTNKFQKPEFKDKEFAKHYIVCQKLEQTMGRSQETRNFHSRHSAKRRTRKKQKPGRRKDDGAMRQRSDLQVPAMSFEF